MAPMQSVAFSCLASCCFILAVGASTPKFLTDVVVASQPGHVSSGITIANETAVYVEKGAVASAATDAVCQAIEVVMQGYVKQHCAAKGTVTCVWGNTAACSADDYCKITSKCGYVEDNPFIKFSGYTCEVTDAAKLIGTVTCSPTLTPLAVVAIAAACFLVACGCCTFIWCCCCRR